MASPSFLFSNKGMDMLRSAVKLIAPKSALGYNLPSPEWFDFAVNLSRYTPDIAVLEEHAWQLYFACDETQRGHLKNDLCGADQEYKVPAYTQQSFNYWNHEAPFIPPIPMEASGYRNPMPFYPEIAKIKGQILKIRPQQFLHLDNYKENGVQYERRKVRLIVPYRTTEFIHDLTQVSEDIEFVSPNGHIARSKEKTAILRAWMYIGIPKYWDKLISAFDYTSVQTFEAKNRPWCKTYYQLRRPAK
jgi:hypothetical protein